MKGWKKVRIFGCVLYAVFLFLSLDTKPDLVVREISQNKTLVLKDIFPLEVSNGAADRIEVALTKRKPSKTKISTAVFTIEFLSKSNMVFSMPFEVNYEQGAEGSWYLYQDVMKNGKSVDNRFVKLVYGYETCGYPQSNLLYYVDAKTIWLVDKWETVSDGGYGIYRDIFANFEGEKVTSFSCRTLEVGEGEKGADSLETIEIAYKDSIFFKFDGTSWKPQNLTPNDVIYRKELLTADEYFKN